MNFRQTYRLVILLLIAAPSALYAQLTVSGAKTPVQLVEDVLLGAGVTATNITYTGANIARGEFNSVNSNIGFDAGVLLTSGSINNAIGPNNSGSRSQNNFRPGDPDINTIIAPNTSRDASVLEFDFKPLSDTILFNYIFASEEYPEYAPPISSTFNDAFAFLLTGPNPAGGTYTNVNIALIPGTSTPVSINNVNQVTNTAYYVANGNNFNGSQSNPNSPANINNVQFDAFTAPLTAIAAVVPCATYHIKLVVADAVDFVYDSGVFLEANSFGSKVPNPQINFVTTAPACTGDTVSFLNTGSTGPGILYKWYFGSGANIDSSTLENPTDIVYNTPGLKLIEYNMNVNCGDTTMKMFQGIVIDETPAPSFNSNAPQCENQPVNFTYTGTSGSNWTYIWDFGSGASPATSFSQNPSGINYSTPGTKTVTLTVKNGSCVETISQTITINARPTASFTSTAPTGVGSGVNFSNTGTTGASYAWTFGTSSSPSSSTNENPNGITYGTEGSKTITLITSQAGCADTSIAYINILTTPNPSFSSNAPQPVGFPVLFIYTGNTGGGFTYSWDFGAGALPNTSSAKNPPAVFYSTPGTKTITLTVTNGLVTIVFTQTITIDVPPTATFTSSAPNCERVGIDFMSTANPGTTYNWNFGTGASPATSALANPTNIIYSSSGFKTVQLITTLNGDSDTSESVIYIIKQPQVSFIHTGPQCMGSPVDFNYTGNNGSNWIYTWDFGTGANPNISSGTSPQGILYGSHGTKTASLTVSNAYCSDTASLQFTINPTPSAGFTSTGPSCSGDSVSFTNTGSTGLSYSWDLGAGASPPASTDENPQFVSYASHGIKTIRQVVTQGACSDTAYNTVNILETPMPSFTGPVNVCEGSHAVFAYTGNASSNWIFQWDFGSGANPGNASSGIPPIVAYNSPGTKAITLSVSNQFCVEKVQSTILVDESPVASIVTSSPVCTGDSLQLGTNANGPNFIHSWTFSGNPVFNNSTWKAVYAQPGIEAIKLVTGFNNCFDSAEVSIVVNETPQAGFVVPAGLCQRDAATFLNTSSKGSRWNYQWDFGSNAFPSVSTAERPNNIRFNSSGDHEVSLRVSDKNCFNQFIDTVFINALPKVYAGVDTILCADDCVEIGEVAQNNLSYSWFPASGLNDPKISNPTACPSAEFTQYVLSAVNDTSGCVSSDTVLLTMLGSAMANAGPDVELCFGDSIQIGSAPIEGHKYSWSPSDGISNPSSSSTYVSPPSDGFTYTLNVSYQGCDTIQDQVDVVLRRATAVINEDITIAKGEKTELNASGGVLYRWTPFETLNNPNIPNPMAKPLESTTYYVTVTDVFNCEDTASVTVSVVEPDLFVPTAFTPDGSGRNDVFRVRGNPIRDFELSIFDRKGELIYYSKDFYKGWDGRSQSTGQDMPKGAYIYKIRGFDEMDEELTINGMINLIR